MCTSLKFRDIILSTDEPLIIKNTLKWNFLEWDLEKWARVLGKEVLVFRQGKNDFTKNPQFENTTDTVKLTFREFLHYQKHNPDKWLYFDYKYLKEWLLNISDIQNNIDWSDFGFPELNCEDTTIWIGSRGAHTPCHKDTYGCNMIAQIYGQKRWILFPPEENLLPTRIPYEESSVYSKLNFFTPNTKDFKNIKNGYSVVLNPGDVLILPHRWWHYVENIDVAISMNTWLKLPIDQEERIGESVVHLLVSQMVKQLKPELRQELINPNNGEQEQLHQENIMNSLSIVRKCLDNYRETNLSVESTSKEGNFKEILKTTPNLKVLQKLPIVEFNELIEIQKNKFPMKYLESEKPNRQFDNILNAILHDDVVNVIKQKLLEK